jgi:hypothetical protein
MDKWMKWIGWTILTVLILGMGVLLYARYHPNLLVKLIGPYGYAGQLVGIYDDGSGQLLIEEMIDNDHGIGVEGGAGFSVQLKKLAIVDLKKESIQKIGVAANTKLLSFMGEVIWIFEEKTGLKAISVIDGHKLADWNALIALNPHLINKVINSMVYLHEADGRCLILEDLEGNFWRFNEQFKAYQSQQNCPSERKKYPLLASHISESNEALLLSLKTPYHTLNSNKKVDKLINAAFLMDQHTGLAVQPLNREAYLIIHYKNKLNEGFRLTQIDKKGRLQWQKNYDHLLDRKGEKFLLAGAYPLENTLCLILDTNKGTRLIWIQINDGRVLKNERI